MRVFNSTNENLFHYEKLSSPGEPFTLIALTDNYIYIASLEQYIKKIPLSDLRKAKALSDILELVDKKNEVTRVKFPRKYKNSSFNNLNSILYRKMIRFMSRLNELLF